MVACYHPGSAGYSYHVDNPDHDGRVLTAIFYLNKGWRPADGGCVRLHPSLLVPSPAAPDDAGSPTAAPPQGSIDSSKCLTSRAPGVRTPLVAMSVDQVSARVAEGLRNKLDAGIILRLVQKIKVEEIDGEVLDSLDEVDMEQVLGLSTFGQRRKFSQMITRLSSGAGSEGAAGADTDVETGAATGATEQTNVSIDKSDAPVDVRPIDGRLLLFWSDQRTPHEVLPLSANANLKDGRIAVTCWYYDAGERAKALASSGTTAETLLSASAASPLSSSQSAVAKQQDDTAVAAATAVARNKKKNRKKKERRKKKKRDVEETSASSDENGLSRSSAEAAAAASSSAKAAKRVLNVTAPKTGDVVITEVLLSERIAALLAKEGKDSFLAMKAPQFFERLQVRGSCLRA
jgi:hypothetical protein